MLLKYFTLFLLNSEICWAYLVRPFEEQIRATYSIPDSEDAGERLILTEFIRSNRIEEALKLSNVEPLLNGSKIISNSGYFTVNETFNSNLFFWFFRQSSNSWQEAPLVLWLQGGPGSPSTYGVFEENGPFIVTESGLELSNFSWTTDYNVLYIDQPVGTGFSFTDPEGYISTQEQVTDHLYVALTQFFQLLPELKKNAFYISGESYAGRYVAAISYRIHTLRQAGKSDINLKGLFMVSAFTNGLQNGMTNFYYQHGLIDSTTKAGLELIEEDIESFIHAGLWRNSFDGELKLISGLESYSGLVDWNDYSKFSKDHIYSIEFIQTIETRKKIHAGNADFSFNPHLVADNFDEDRARSVVPWIEELIEHYPIAFVGGQYDANVPYPTVLNVMKTLKWSGAFEYSKAERKQFVSGGEVVGYYKTAGNLKDILVRRAGHSVPKDQPQATLELLNMFVKDRLSEELSQLQASLEFATAPPESPESLAPTSPAPNSAIQIPQIFGHL